MINIALLFPIIFIITYFDPQNTLGLRPIFLYLSIPLWIYGIKSATLKIRNNYATLVICYIMPIWGVVVYIFRGDGAFKITDTSYISFALTYAIINLFETKENQDNFKKASIVSGLIFSIMLIYVAVELVALESSVATDFFISNDIARVAFREYGGINIPYVYFYASTLLILPLSVLFSEIYYKKTNKSKDAIYLIMILALFLSGTRSHIIISTLLFAGYLYFKGGFIRIIGLASIVYIVVIQGGILGIILNMLSTQESTNSQKISMLGLYGEIFNDPLTILIGQGYQGVDWSSELQQMVNYNDGERATKTELTYLELFRVYGIVLPVITLIGLAEKIFKRTSEHATYKKLAITLLLADSALNPHLFSTYGALILAISMSPTPFATGKRHAK